MDGLDIALEEAIKYLKNVDFDFYFWMFPNLYHKNKSSDKWKILQDSVFDHYYGQSVGDTHCVFEFFPNHLVVINHQSGEKRTYDYDYVKKLFEGKPIIIQGNLFEEN